MRSCLVASATGLFAGLRGVLSGEHPVTGKLYPAGEWNLMDIRDVESLTEAIQNGWRAEFLFFWGHTPKDTRIGKHVLSDWWPATFSIDGQAYPTAEHYMMAQKARLFGDDDQAYGKYPRGAKSVQGQDPGTQREGLR